MRTLVIADNQDITKAGILYLSGKMPGFLLTTEASGKQELLQLLIRYPDAVVLLDYTLFDLVGADDLIILHDRFRHTDWILFSDDLSDDFVRRIIFSTESVGIILKDDTLDTIRTSLEAALRSERFISPRIRNLFSDHKPVKELKERPVLTTAEREILKLIAQGRTTKEIAAERFSSIHTIMTHRKNIFRKLEVNNVHEATKYALRAGIIDTAEYYI